jgi:hypothetical protein
MFSVRTVSSVAALLVAAFAVTLYANDNHQENLSSPSVYEAPLIGADDPHRVHGEYYVKLQQNHFEKHIEHIGTQRHVQIRLGEEFNNSYVANKVENDLLAAIRADPGVISVEVNRAYSLEEVIDKVLPNPEDI